MIFDISDIPLEQPHLFTVDQSFVAFSCGLPWTYIISREVNTRYLKTSEFVLAVYKFNM